jgi:ubiquinone/menaquinone biosynthesis C-methylase UbiE
MCAWKFDPAKMAKLDDPGRLVDLDPDVMWRLTEPAPDAVVVEIGAGTGMFAAEFARRLTSGRVIAVDIAEPMIDWMRAHLSADVRDRVEPVLSTESTLPLPEGVADVVFMVNVHHELEDPVGVLAEAQRVLAPGGRLLLVDWRPIDTPKGPPVAARIAPGTAVAQTVAAGFRGPAVHEDLRYHWAVTAVRP